MAGSSLPVTWRMPSVEMPLGARIREAMCVGYGGVDSYDFHGLETIQCMVERRQGGESGVKWLQAYRGENFWKAYAGRRLAARPDARRRSAAATRSRRRGRASTTSSPPWTICAAWCKDPVAYHYEHADGLKCTLLMMNGLVQDFNFAARLEGRSEPFSTQMYLPMPPGRTTLANFFSPLVQQRREDVPDRASPLIRSSARC